MTMQQLHHKAREPLECARDAHGRRYIYQDPFRGFDIDLELSRFIDWRVEQGKQTLMTKVSITSAVEVSRPDFSVLDMVATRHMAD